MIPGDKVMREMHSERDDEQRDRMRDRGRQPHEQRMPIAAATAHQIDEHRGLTVPRLKGMQRSEEEAQPERDFVLMIVHTELKAADWQLLFLPPSY